MTSPDVVICLNSIFARHGIPDQLLSDNGPQFSASSFTKFAEEYGFTHITTSPRYPQANGQVQTMNTLLKKAADPYKALMAYHFPPLESGIIPAELLMGRKSAQESLPCQPFCAQVGHTWSSFDKRMLP